MTDDLVKRLRVIGCFQNGDAICTCVTGMEAADRIEKLTKERDEALAAWELEAAAVKRFAERHERHLTLGAEVRARAERLEEALLWCSGSADFNEGGVARKGWLKVCAPLLKGADHE